MDDGILADMGHGFNKEFPDIFLFFAAKLTGSAPRSILAAHARAA
jgi:hypothetical protein